MNAFMKYAVRCGAANSHFIAPDFHDSAIKLNYKPGKSAPTPFFPRIQPMRFQLLKRKETTHAETIRFSINDCADVLPRALWDGLSIIEETG